MDKLILELKSYATYFRAEQPNHDLLLANKLEHGVELIQSLQAELSTAQAEIEKLKGGYYP